MLLFIKTCTGKDLVIEVEPENTILDIKKRVEELDGQPPLSQTMRFGNIELNDNNKTLSFYGVKKDSKIHLMMTFRK